MGINTFWKAISDADLVHVLQGRQDLEEIAAYMNGKVVAIDLGIWIFEAATQKQIRAVFKINPFILKVLFERVLNWLQFGTTPVGVADGAMPYEKAGVLRARGILKDLPEHRSEWGSRHIVEEPPDTVNITDLCCQLLEAMGLPVVRAPGEAEATAAALNLAGNVDAVASRDGDALLFGAQTVLKEAKLHVGEKNSTHLARCEATEVGAQLLGCNDADTTASALLAVALLTGGDYDNQKGASGVDALQAFPAVRKVMDLTRALNYQGGLDTIGPVEVLRAELRSPVGTPPPARCAGCQRCGHDSGQGQQIEEHNAARRCPRCPSNTCGLCASRQTAQPGCQCAFCSDPYASVLYKVIHKARATADFRQRSRIAHNAYVHQQMLASRAVGRMQQRLRVQPGERLQWLRPPDEDEIYAVLEKGGLGGPGGPSGGPYQHQWDRRELKGKCVALHQMWAARQAAQAPAL